MIDFLAFLFVFFLGTYAGYRMTCQYYNRCLDHATAMLNDVIENAEDRSPRMKD